MLLVVINALSLSFLQKTVIGTSAAVSRQSAMKTDYLARSAANHALWRLLNDPDFAPTSTDYDMHDFGDGRYGYKVRKPSLTQFGTVATVGAVGDTVSKQSYVQYLKPYNIITTYDRTSGSTPKYRQLYGAFWGDAADTINDGSAQAQWMVLKGCSQRKEIIMGTLDNDGDINFAVWDGETWSNLKEFTSNAGSTSYRSFDIAYENLSGDALVVGRYNDNSTVRYNIWNGTAWTFGTAQTAFSLDDKPSFVVMASKSGSDEILIAAVASSKKIKVVQWNGSAFNDLGEVDNSMETGDYGSAAVVYEQQSGTGVVLWNHSSSKRIYYRLWDGIALSATMQLPQFGEKIYMIRAAADPSSDTIFVAAVDSDQHLSVAVWDGDAWTDSREIFNSVSDKVGQVIDVAWESSGNAVLVVCGASSNKSKVRYYNWQSGNPLSDYSMQTGPNFQNDVYEVILQPISGTQKIVLLGSTSGNKLRYSIWTGNRFLGDPGIQLESSLSGNELPFGIAESIAP